MQLSYRVRSGDTLYKIAKRWEIPVESLISANLLSSPYTIYAGQRLSIPSGAEGLIAYFSSRGGHDDLWLFNPRTGANRPLTNGLGASFSTPVWSPDSRRIAFAGKNGVVYVVGVTTGSLAGIDQLDEGEGDVLDWSPDGRKLAYTKRDRILIYDVATHEAHSIQRPGATDVQWFPAEPIRWLDGIRITALQWSPSADVERPEKITYFSPVYKIRLLYPSHWHRVSDERYEGPDGFFQVSAISAEADLGQVCRGEAFHPLRPYGSQPRIIKARVSGQEACFILPSKDQPAEMKGQSALIARYPRPVVIGGTVYPYFILWADRGHIAGLSSTLAFVP